MKMKIETVLDVSPEQAADIQYLWDATTATSEEIARLEEVPLEVVWDVLGGAYNEADHKEHIAHYENHTN
tara:strand:- start:323 stop:532 length:210 start_codon:yes stop_codon:yes gene_type:complete